MLLVSGMLHAQKDTIFTKGGRTISCTITLVNDMNIFYTDIKGRAGDYIALDQVSRYKQSGKVTVAQAISIKKDTTIQVQVQPEKPISISDEMFFMRNCLAKHSREYMTGVGVMAVGVAFAGIGAALAVDEPSTGVPIMGVGGALVLIGTIVTIDSHKWFKRAALGVNGTGAYVKYTF